MRWRLACLIRREPFDRQKVTIKLKLTLTQRASFWRGINREPSNNNPIALHSIRPFDSPSHVLIAFNNGSDLRLFEDQKTFLSWPLTGLICHEIPHAYKAQQKTGATQKCELVLVWRCHATPPSHNFHCAV